MKLKLQTWVNIAVLVILFSAPINVSADAVSDWKILTIPDWGSLTSLQELGKFF